VIAAEDTEEEEMPYCFAFGCNHESGRSDCKLYRFPVDYRQRTKWIDLCRL